jgi:hypothetical protein
MESNQYVHADLFAPLKTSGDKKFLCLTDAFTKYVELVIIPNKEALTVVTGIFNWRICKFGLPLEIVTDHGKKITNQMAQPLFEALDIRYPTTSTITKHLTAFVDDTTLDFEIYVPVLMFAYNTSFHWSVQATAFSHMYGLKAQLPSFFALDFCRMHGPKMENDNLLCMLHDPRDLAVQNNLLATDRQNEDFDKKASNHMFHEGQYVPLNEFNFLNKNKKLAPKFSGSI